MRSILSLATVRHQAARRALRKWGARWKYLEFFTYVERKIPSTACSFMHAS